MEIEPGDLFLRLCRGARLVWVELTLRAAGSSKVFVPLAGQGFAWVIPAVVGMLIGGAIWSATGRAGVDHQPEAG